MRKSPLACAKHLRMQTFWPTRINSLHDDIAQHLDNALAQLKQNTEAASEISVQFRDTEAHLAAAVEKSAADGRPVA